MDRPDETLRKSFATALGLPNDAAIARLEYGRHERWDSVAHMRLVSEIERAFGVMLEHEDVIGLSSYAAAVEILTRQGIKF